MRVDRFLSLCGAATRSEASKAAKRGEVSVDGTVVKRLDTHIDPEKAAVVFRGLPVVYRQNTYIMLNKPEGYVSATEDGDAPTVLELLPPELSRLSLFPCGRLDKYTTGLLLVTDDGQLAHRMLAPRSHVDKTYFYRCESPLSEEDRKKLEGGVDIGEEKPTKPCKVKIEGDGLCGRITICEGKYHQIKRMFESVKNRITTLERVSFGPLELDGSLARGGWRFLSADETEAVRALL